MYISLITSKGSLENVITKDNISVVPKMADISLSGEVGVRAFRSGLLELRGKFLLETGRDDGRPSVLYPDPSRGSVASRSNNTFTAV